MIIKILIIAVMVMLMVIVIMITITIIILGDPADSSKEAECTLKCIGMDTPVELIQKTAQLRTDRILRGARTLKDTDSLNY